MSLLNYDPTSLSTFTNLSEQGHHPVLHGLNEVSDESPQGSFTKEDRLVG